MNNIFKIFISLFLSITAIQLPAEVLKGTAQIIPMEDYPDQGSYINTLRFEYFRMPEEKTFWAEMSLWKYNFYSDGSERSVEVIKDKDHPKMEYKLWIQDGAKSKLVVILPGMGGHYTSSSVTVMAHMLFKIGYTVVAMNSAMHPDFMESAATAIVPGYTPFDAKDTYNAIEKVFADLQAKYKDKQFTEKVLLGYSLGALHTLFISDMESSKPLALFDRYIAINPPVDMLYSLERLEDVYDVWELWNRDEFNQRIDFTTGIYLGMLRNKIPSMAYIPLHNVEAQYLLGKSYHIVLRNIIYSIHKRRNFGFLTAQSSWFNREYLYQEIEKFSYIDFRDTFIKKYYEEVFKGRVSMEQLNVESGLAAIEKSLAINQKIRVLHNEDDFLLRPADPEWLKLTFKERLTFFKKGGHLGNLYTKEFQEKLLQLLQ